MRHSCFVRVKHMSYYAGKRACELDPEYKRNSNVRLRSGRIPEEDGHMVHNSPTLLLNQLTFNPLHLL